MLAELSTRILGSAEREKYNIFVLQHPLGSIHQSYEWGEFQAQSPARDKFFVVAVLNGGGEIVASALLIRQKLPRGKCWFYCPRGPLVNYEKELEEEQLAASPSYEGGEISEFGLLLGKIKEIAKDEEAIFLRIDPGIELGDSAGAGRGFDFQEIGFRLAHAHYQPENTLILNLEGSKEEILAQMKQKGRYNIKLAQKHGVVVEKFGMEDGVDQVNGQECEQAVANFHRLLTDTTVRDGFSGHPLSYYEQMLKILGSGHARLYLAKYQGEVVAGMIVTFFHDTAIYYFGASGNKHRQVMAPYLLQWEAMCDAKALGMKHYDFLGIAPEGAEKHAWAGVTDFKTKFGGRRVNYLPAQELVFKPTWYLAMRMVKKLRR